MPHARGAGRVSLRRAVASDAPALAALAERTFRDAFSEHNTPADLTMFCEASYSAARQAGEIADPAVETWLAVGGMDELVGYFQIRSAETEEAPAGCRSVELWRFYVSGAWHGRGVAQAMMVHVFARARAQARDAVWLGVWEHNARAIAFYAKFGFAEYGEHPFVLGTDHQRDLLLCAPVTGLG